MARSSRWLLLAVLVLLPSCFVARQSLNVSLDPAAVAALVPGESTQEDVIAALGAPSDVVQLAQRSAWLYLHLHTKRAGLWLLVVFFLNEDTRSDRVWVFFDEQGVMTHVATAFDADEAEFAMPWENLDD